MLRSYQPVQSPRLSPPREHDRSPLRVECEQRPEMSAERAQLLHVVMARPLDPVGGGPAERGALYFEEFDRREHRRVVVVIETEDPLLRDGGEVDVPGHSPHGNACITEMQALPH